MSGYAIRNDGVYGCRSVASAKDCAANEDFSRVWLAAAPPLAHIKAQACSRIDATAEKMRQGVLTPGSGQAIEYQKTCTEAVAALAAAAAGTELTVTAYPFLAAEQTALTATTGSVTLLQVAQAVAADVTATNATLAAIKAARRTGKLAINAATDAAGVAAAEAAVVWPEG